MQIIGYICAFVAVILIVLVALNILKKHRESFVEKAEKDLDVLYSEVRGEQLWLLGVLGVLGGGGILWAISGNLIVGLVGAVAGIFVPGTYLKLQLSKRLKKFENQLVDAIMLTGNSLKAGLNLIQAVDKVTKELGAPISEEFGLALRENRLGTPIDKALSNIQKRVKSEDLGIMINAMNISMETGGNLSEAFGNIAHTIRERKRIQGKIEGLTSQGKMEAYVCTALPWGLAAMLYIVDPEMIRPLFTTPIGYGMLGTVIVMEILGFLWIRKIVNIDI
jgi:tight adherence protein B